MKRSGRRRTSPAPEPIPAGAIVTAARTGDGRAVRGRQRSGSSSRPPRPTSLARTLAAAVDAVTVLDRDWRIVFINQRSAELLGASRAELVGRNVWTIHPGSAAGRAYHEFHRAMRDQVSTVVELFSPNVGRVLQCTILPTAEGLIAITRDVHDSPATPTASARPQLGRSVRPAVVEALQSSEQRFRALIENSHDAVLMVDVRGRVLYASPRVFGEDGVLPAHALGPDLLPHLHPADAARARADFVRLTATPNATVRDSYRVRHRSGRWMWIEGIAHNRLHDPAVGAIVINCRDVTERRDVEAAYRSLVDHSFQAQLIAQNGRIVIANPTLAELSGCTLDELYSSSFEQLMAMVHDEDRAIAIRALTDGATTAHAGQVYAWRYLRRDGVLRWVECRVAAIEYGGEPALQVSLLDATEKRRAEEALRFSEQHFRSLIEGALDLVTVIDDWGNVLYASPSHQRVLGWAPEEIVGRGILGLVHPDDRAPLARDFEAAIAGQASSRLNESRVRHKDGSWRVIESITHRSPTASPVGGYIVNARDVTERKAAEQKTSILLELARDLASTLDAAELLARVGRHVAAALQCELVSTQQWDEAEQRYVIDFHFGSPPAGVAKLIPLEAGRSFIARLADGPATFDDAASGSGVRHAISRRFGVTSFAAAPLRSSARYHGALIAATTRRGHRFDGTHAELLGAIAGQLAVVLERAELHRQQQEDAQLFGALARVGQELLAGFDRPDLPDRLCRVTAEVLDCTTAHTLAWHPDDDTCSVIATHGASREAAEAQRVVRIPKRVVLDLLAGPAARQAVQLVSGGSSAGSALAAMLGIPGGAPFLIVPLRRGNDVVGIQTAWRNGLAAEFGGIQLKIATGLARLGSLALEHARTIEELSRANRLKSDFVAMISHELRTPLNVILGYSDLLLDETFGALQPAQADVLRGIHASGGELLRLIRDVLDLSRLESGRSPLDLKEISVPELIAELEAGARVMARDGEVELHVELDTDLCALVTDPAKLAVVLKNLLANAFKFTVRGRVTLAALPQDGGVAFVVADTGIGIPSEQLGIIFEPFRQGDAAPTRRHGGVGLGLYVVRRMVEMLGGSIDVASEPGRGSRFRVWLPRRVNDDAPDQLMRAAASRPSSSDALTGLPSLPLFCDRLTQAIHASEPRRVAGAVLFIKLDCSGALATHAGPGTRAALLCMVGERLLSVLRMTDTVCHPGGDDFLVLLPGRVTEQAVENLSRLLLDGLTVAFLVDGLPRHVAAAIGAVIANGGHADSEAIIARAQRAAWDARQTRLRTTIVHVAPQLQLLEAATRERSAAS